MVALRPLKRVVWSVVGSGGFTASKETAEVLQLARSGGNFAGVMLDDFFHDGKEAKRAQWTVDELANFRRELKQIGEHLDIYATLYDAQLGLPLHDYLDLIDVVTLWSMDSADVRNMEASLKKVEAIAPKTRKLLGCYVVDYAQKRGFPWS